ncbi:unnamed protein product [Thlaspi arvense]|uniref:Uncharacterized protein n=1 Tax=Thlaspi arvense TaxID=13288 RepID=A0AAU9RYC8_THLAR|nr:unnamed protein product [Thlaspi arvense]
MVNGTEIMFLYLNGVWLRVGGGIFPLRDSRNSSLVESANLLRPSFVLVDTAMFGHPLLVLLGHECFTELATTRPGKPTAPVKRLVVIETEEMYKSRKEKEASHWAIRSPLVVGDFPTSATDSS